jgi:hypothetical protein
MAENRSKADTVRRVWGRRFLAATVVVPPSMAEHLNMDAMAVLAVIRNEAETTGRCTLSVARIATSMPISAMASATSASMRPVDLALSNLHPPAGRG